MNLKDLQDQKSILWEKPRRCEVIKSVPINKGTKDVPKTEWIKQSQGKGHCYGGTVATNSWLVELDDGQGMVCSFAELKFIQD